MQLLSILALATSVAAGVPRDTTIAYVWEVLKWQAGESHGNPTAPVTGWFNFNVSGPRYGEVSTHIPPFFAHCEGTADGSPLSSNLTVCSLDKVEGGAPDAAVLARVLPVQDIQVHIAITYLFHPEDQPITPRNFTVIVVQDWARERPPHNFTVHPDEIV
ncbi:uncharacterized protein F4822DRAFT_406230 [Hypoxylon trugodes]|uniref:uncharacterized protein n=1 Tax=Hypoxylon trugodes TaxID=326681 RepID=UPI00219F50DE|nr:uncharacterized protein F4822DRAFT_406230 [Hypoxylon trugodes]KAI1387366.1 hypothetical protein F4822DRAFT_406230 [Hypoxylon trugodes]